MSCSDFVERECIYVSIDDKGSINLFDITRLHHFIKHSILAAYHKPCKEHRLEIRFVYENFEQCEIDEEEFPF